MVSPGVLATLKCEERREKVQIREKRRGWSLTMFKLYFTSKAPCNTFLKSRFTQTQILIPRTTTQHQTNKLHISVLSHPSRPPHHHPQPLYTSPPHHPSSSTAPVPGACCSGGGVGPSLAPPGPSPPPEWCGSPCPPPRRRLWQTDGVNRLVSMYLGLYQDQGLLVLLRDLACGKQTARQC